MHGWFRSSQSDNTCAASSVGSKRRFCASVISGEKPTSFLHSSGFSFPRRSPMCCPIIVNLRQRSSLDYGRMRPRRDFLEGIVHFMRSKVSEFIRNGYWFSVNERRNSIPFFTRAKTVTSAERRTEVSRLRTGTTSSQGSRRTEAYRTIFAVSSRKIAGWNRAPDKSAEAMRGDKTAARASRLIQSRP